MDRLKARISQTPYVEELTKLTKPGSVGFVSEPSRHDSGNSSDDVRSLLLEWRDGLARLDRDKPRGGVTYSRWTEIYDDAVVVFNDWARAAAAIGWSELDLFGVDPLVVDDLTAAEDAPHGLVWRLHGRPVERLVDSRAQYRLRSGGLGMFPRGGATACVPIWRLSESRK